MLPFDAPIGPWWPYVFVLIAGFLATDSWRWAGVLIGTSLKQDSELLIWVRAVAPALVAGVIAKLVLVPQGSLAEVPLAVRLAAIAAAMAVFLLTGRRIIYGILVAEAILIGSMFLI
jgi:hypothetical protein